MTRHQNRSFMRTLTRTLPLACMALLIATSSDLFAQSNAKYADSELRTGTLPNGFRYFVRQNALPPKRVELVLAVEAGSVHEDEDQRGLAHFVEHMAFNGTKRFPKQRILQFFESIGGTVGSDVNASTTQDGTVYNFTVPAEPAILDTALMIIEDWAQDVTFDPKEIEFERGVVMEERRMNIGPALDREAKHAPLILGNRYARRSPLGLGHILKTAPRSAFTRFYQDWYHPGRMSIIVVGDIDPVKMEATIKERFGKIPKRTSPRASPDMQVPSWNAPIASIAEGDDVQRWSASLIYPLSARDTGWSVEVLRRQVTARMFYAVLNKRLRALASAKGSPIRSASASPRTLGTQGRAIPAHSIQIEAEEPTTLELGIIAVRAEIARLARDGVLPDELEFVRNMQIEQATEQKLRVDQVSSESLLGRYLTAAANRRTFVLSAKAEIDLLLQFAPAVKPPDLQALAKEIEDVVGWVITADAPKSSQHGALTTTMLIESVRSGEKRKLPPYSDTTLAHSFIKEALLARKPTAGSIAQRRTVDKIGVTEWILSNGARVILKPTPWEKNMLAIQAEAPGGISLATDAEYLNASVASRFVTAGGLGPYDAKTLERRTTGKVSQWSVGIEAYQHGVIAAGSPRYAESIFEVLHLAFTAPRIDPEAVTRWRKSARRNYPRGFDFELRRALATRHPRARPVAGAAADSVDTTGVLNFYKARFGDASQFTFVIVGDFEPDSLRPLIEQYIGGLPGSGTHKPLQARDLGIRPTTEMVRRIMVGGDSLSKTLMTFTSEAAYTPESKVAMRSLAAILNSRLRTRLREELGGTYVVSVNGTASMIPYGREQLQITWQSQPERIDELQNAALAVIDTLVTNGFTQEELLFTQRMLSQQRDAQKQSSRYWSDLLAQTATEKRTLEDIASEEENFRTVTTESVQAAMRRVLKRDRYILMMELPVRSAPVDKDELLTNPW